MTRSALLLALGLAGCAAPRPAGFDATDWLARARASAVAEAADTDSDDPRVPTAHALSAELDAAVGWARACDTYWDAEAQREVTEPVEPGGGHFLRGVYAVTDLSPTEALVAVTCDFGAYQGSYALVHVDGRRAALLRAPAVDETGAPYGPPTAVYSTVRARGGARSFETLGLARGLGDCGTLSRYRVTAFGVADLVEARARTCAGSPASAPPPEAWPVVYP